MWRLAASLLLGLGALAPAAWAAVGRDQAVALAQRITPGTVLSIERGLHVDNTIVWRIQIVTAAKEIRLLVIDAETGRAR